jgi:hypothetical protein
MRSVKTVTMVVVGVALVLTLAGTARAGTLGLWTFNEYGTNQTINTGGGLLDSSGSQRHMRVAGGDVTTIAGAAGGTAIQFTSASRAEFAPGNDFGGGLVASTSDFNFGSTDSFTIEAEIKPTADLNAWFGKGFNGGANPQFYLWYDAPNTRLFALTYDTTNAGVADANPKAISAGWHHVALVRDATAHTLSSYVDGTLAASGADPSGSLSTAGFFSLNTQNSDGQYYSSNLAMDFARVSDVALSPNQFLTSDVPEPSMIILLATGVLGLLAYAWRKRRYV